MKVQEQEFKSLVSSIRDRHGFNHEELMANKSERNSGLMVDFAPKLVKQMHYMYTLNANLYDVMARIRQESRGESYQQYREEIGTQ